MAQIEIEFRAKVSDKDYQRLSEFLISKAKDLGQDDKETVFYILPDKLFKVVNEVSKKKAKIVLKDKRIGSGNDFGEWEIDIKQDKYKTAVEIFDQLKLPGKVICAWQERHNYLYKGVEIAIKFSDHWQHHVEMEMVINKPKEKNDAEQKIRRVAKELGVNLMTEKEIKDFTDTVESKL